MFVEEEIVELQKLQDAFCKVGHVYSVLVDTTLQTITKFSGDVEAERYIDDLMDLDAKRSFLAQFSDMDGENVIAYVTAVKYLMVRGVALRDGNSRLKGVWIIYAIDMDRLTADDMAPGFMECINEAQLDATVALVENVAAQLYRENMDKTRLLDQLEMSQIKEVHNASRLQKSEVMTEILKEMEAEDSFAKIAEQILESAGMYLEVSECALLKVEADDEHVDMLCEWADSEGHGWIRDFGVKTKADFPFMTGRPYTISGDTMIPENFGDYFKENALAAGIYLPITLGDKLAMYIMFQMCGVARKWTVDELTFANDVKRVIQMTLTKHVTKNSLASSYSALEQILEHIGCAVTVYDLDKHTVLYSNENYESLRITEQDRIELVDDLMHPERDLEGSHEFYAKQSEKWLEISFSYINWVDGRKVCLATIYDLTKTKQYQKEIEKRAGEDYLTGLYNRLRCEEDLEKMIHATVRSVDESALLYIDLDDFDHINDAIGHQNGDLLLKSVAEALNHIEGVSGHCYRIGGDEFVVLVSNRNFGRLENIIDSIKNVFSKPWYLGGKDYYCTMSMGVVIMPKDGVTVDTLMQRADIALHWAKNQGKNRVEYYNSNQASNTSERLDLERAMRSAVEEGCKEFEVYYQPLMDITNDGERCCGAEALLRWNSKTLGMVMPDKFIPLAEYLGLINDIGAHVLHEAASRCKYWNDFGHPEYKVNVNLSVVQLVQTDIVDVVKKTLEDTNIKPSNLTLEVTESLAVNDMDKMQQVLGEIKALGVHVALDDFGTGYSSLNHIRSMPIDVIKIDKCFVGDIGEDSFADAFVTSVSQLADALDLNVVVEGVELEEQKEVLDEMNVDMLQGFFFDKPLTQEEFESKYLI